MYRMLSAALLCMMITMSLGQWGVAIELPLHVVVDGDELLFPDAQAFIDGNSRTQVPARFIAEALGAEVSWDSDTREASFVKGNQTMVISIDSRDYTLAGRKLSMDTEAIILEGRTFVPARYVAEAFGAEVGWDGDIRTVYIVSGQADEITTGSGESTNVPEVDLTEIVSAYNQAYQENYDADTLEVIMSQAHNSYVLLDPFEEDMTKVIQPIKDKGNIPSAYMSIGTGEDWRDDFDDLLPHLVEDQWQEWQGEYYIRTLTDEVKDVMEKRLDYIAELGFEWVEFDNMDWALYEDSRQDYGIEISDEEAIAYYTDLCQYARELGLNCMAKNLTDDIMYFDGITFESYADQLNWWDQEGLISNLSMGKLILIVHYGDTDPDRVFDYYKDLYGDGILFIAEDLNTETYRHYDTTK